MRIAFRPLFRCLALGTLGAALAACSTLGDRSRSMLDTVTPYRVEIVQGNVVTREMAAAVRPGMTRQQVREILGTPLLVDVFQPDRWNYAFSIRRAGVPALQRTVVAHFEGERLSRLDAPTDLPTEEEFVAQIDNTRSRERRTPLTLSPEQIQALPKPRTATAPSTLPPITPPTRTYPPLEPRS